MATPKIVPRADGEGGLGTSSLGWGDSYLTGNLEIQSGSATTLSKIVMGTNANKATIGVSGATDTFFTGTGQGDLILRADDNNDKIHLGAGTSGIAAMVVTEVASVGKVGIGTASPGVPLEVLDSTATSATQGGNLRLSANDGAVMASGHRLGVLEFAGAEDAGGSITVGARIESVTKAAWDASNNDAKLSFYSSYDNAQQSEKVDIGGKTAMSVYNDYDTITFENQLADNEGGGEILRYGSAQAGAVGTLHFLHTDNTWDATDADAVATGASQLLGIAMGSDPGTHGMLLKGYFKVASGSVEGTPAAGAPVYISEVAGKVDFTAPSDTNDFLRIIGYCIDIDSSDILLYFNPDSTYVEIA